MDCPGCGKNMICMNNWDVGDEEQPMLRTDYDCSDEQCDVDSISIFTKI